MRARVQLTFNRPVDAALKKRVREASKSNTPDARTVSIRLDPVDPCTLYATFLRYPGRQVDIVDDIFGAYKFRFAELDDTTIYFETKNKLFD